MDLGAAAIGTRPGCPTCGGQVKLGSPHVIVGRRGVRVFCSAACMTSTRAPTEHVPLELPRRSPRRARALFVVGVGLASLSPCALQRDLPPPDVEPVAAASIASLPPPSESQPYGPFLPTRAEAAAEFASSTAGDRWIHPLGAPRRMPLRVSRAFGADRPGDRPSECRSGHCGVDLGHTWGEPVYAVQDGVIDRVNRDPGRSGGKYLRIAHRNGTVFTQYFHLAAMPSGLRKGQRVARGDVVGVIGDTGVQHSGAHLHFTIAVKPEGVSKMIYIDPEPLIALWPLVRADEVSEFSPGVPVGAARARSRARPHRHGDDETPRAKKTRVAKKKNKKKKQEEREVEADAPSSEAAAATPDGTGADWVREQASGADAEPAGSPLGSRALLSVEPDAP